MAVDRYLAVCKRLPVKYRKNMTHIICYAVWVISIVIVSPLFLYTDIEYKNPEDHRIATCIYTFPDKLKNQQLEINKKQNGRLR